MNELIISGLFDELEKIAEEEKEYLITKERLKRLVRYGLPGAAGVGVGYGVGKLIGRPLRRKLTQWGVGPNASKILRYGVPMAAGVGAAYLLAEKTLNDRLREKILSNDND